MLGLIGGTGPEGRGLALRFALAGEDVLIGSRDAKRAEQAASGIRSYEVRGSVEGALNIDAARGADIVLVAVPLRGPSGHADGSSRRACRQAGGRRGGAASG